MVLRSHTGDERGAFLIPMESIVSISLFDRYHVLVQSTVHGPIWCFALIRGTNGAHVYSITFITFIASMDSYINRCGLA